MARRLDASAPSGAARALLARLGAPGVGGLLLLAFGAWLYAVEIPDSQEAVAALEHDVGRLRQQATSASGAHDARAGDSAARLSDPGWPTPAQRSQVTLALLASLERRGVATPTVRYRWARLSAAAASGAASPTLSRNEADAAWRQTIELQFQAPYAVFRDWTQDVLQTTPSLSIDEVKMTRHDALGNAFDVAATLAVAYRAGPPMAAASAALVVPYRSLLGARALGLAP